MTRARKINTAPNARGKRRAFTRDEYPANPKYSAAWHLRLIAGRFVAGRANESEVDEAVKMWRESKDVVPIAIKGPCQTCRFAQSLPSGDRVERGWDGNYPCVSCRRPEHDKWEPMEAAANA